ncbi:hypothetical protein [Achromobacter pulmonis]|nr:hypothetical protein [Achromobacter pulmonis]
MGTFTPKNRLVHPRFFGLSDAFKGPLSAYRKPGFGAWNARFHYKGLNKK